MAHLEDTTRAELQDALRRAENATSAQRLLAAIAYKSGITQTELAAWFDVERKTIYNWLTRLEDGDLLDAATDEPRPGRARKLSELELAEFQELLGMSPEAVGFEAPRWTPSLVQRLLEAEFEVKYSIPSCRRLMKEAGLRYVPADIGPRSIDDGGRGERSDGDAEGGERGFWTAE